MPSKVLVHLASGIGNIVLATPLLVALDQLGCTAHVILTADYPETASLLRDWSLLRSVSGDLRNLQQHSYDCFLPAIPPFYWPRFATLYGGRKNVLKRPADSLFYSNEQEYYLSFARALGYPDGQRPFYRLPVAPSGLFEVGPETLIIAPGCKTGEMALKRWPYFPELAERFTDVALVGTADDLRDGQDRSYHFPSHVRSFVDRLSLRETAEVMAAAGAVVGNDSGLCHVAGAVGTPTLILFGPTPHQTLGQFPANVYVLRMGLACEPCWFSHRFHACGRRIDCLRNLSVDRVESYLRTILGPAIGQSLASGARGLLTISK